jgi:hypothetical protein
MIRVVILVATTVLGCVAVILSVLSILTAGWLAIAIVIVGLTGLVLGVIRLAKHLSGRPPDVS